MTTDVTIIGGGLAGVAAAMALAPKGVRVTILESRPRLGGRASSFQDPVSGTLIDACQHVSMGCCTAFAEFTRTLGIDPLLEKLQTLYFITKDRRISRMRRDPWPAPFHLGRSLASAHYLTGAEKARIGYGLWKLLRTDPETDLPLLPWLVANRQSPRCIQRFWSIVLTSALNESIGNLGLKYSRKVFVDAFLSSRDGFTVELPTVPLARLYGDELRAWLAEHSVQVRENCAVRNIVPQGASFEIHLRNGEVMTSSAVVLAVPFERVLPLLPEAVAAEPFFARIAKLEPSSITSVHLWFDRDAMKLPHAVIVDGLGHWVFRRPGGYVQVVVSASGELKALGRDEIEKRIVNEFLDLFPELQSVKLLRAKVVTEHHATFSARPGVDLLRPPQRTPLANLVLAGDWTATGWPATMEGAVRSGTLAADALLDRG